GDAEGDRNRSGSGPGLRLDDRPGLRRRGHHLPGGPRPGRLSGRRAPGGGTGILCPGALRRSRRDLIALVLEDQTSRSGRDAMRGLWSASCGGVLAVAIGCGGSNGGSGTPAEKFVGVWKGSSIVTAGGQSNNVQTTIPIEQVDPNTVRLHGFCGSGADIYADGPKAAVNGNSFTLDPGSCTYSTPNCSSVMLQVLSGNEMLTTGLPPTLTLANPA